LLCNGTLSLKEDILANYGRKKDLCKMNGLLFQMVNIKVSLHIQALKETIASQRTASTSFDIVVGGRQRRDDWWQERAHIRSMVEVGISWWTEWVAPADRAKMIEAVRHGPLRVE
jgi:hypothetical protein